MEPALPPPPPPAEQAPASQTLEFQLLHLSSTCVVGVLFCRVSGGFRWKVNLGLHSSRFRVKADVPLKRTRKACGYGWYQAGVELL